MQENEEIRAETALTWKKRIKKCMPSATRFCKKYKIDDAQMSRWVHGVKVPSRLMFDYIEKALSKEGV